MGSAAYNDTKILADALHLNVQIVPGFTGNEGEMSMLRNEVVAEVGTAESMEQFVKQGHGFFALALSGDPIGAAGRAARRAICEGRARQAACWLCSRRFRKSAV